MKETKRVPFYETPCITYIATCQNVRNTNIQLPKNSQPMGIA